MNKFARNIRSIAIAGAGCLAISSAHAIETKPTLTLAVAKKMAEACEQKAKAEGWKMNIAVMDDGGNLKFFSRMDDSFLVSVRIAQLKASTSASLPLSSRKFGEIAKQNQGLELVPGVVTFGGGFPIMTGGGKQIGGIGVSGASAEQDEVCAQAGLDAVKDDLK
jgi:glc operon protein GlcG